MLRVVAHGSAAAAHQYYAQGLKREDYYSEGQEIAGKWYGKAAQMLGLSGSVLPEAFAALVENRHPGTGEKLTPRMKADRRVGYDLNFHSPKSLSILYAITQDKDVLRVFREAVAGTMQELEERAETRVRKSGARANRVTGNLAWAEFVHFTARPVGGVPDPHLHAHCFAMNLTFDHAESRWKAAEFGVIKREAHYAEAAFHARLTTSLAALGYGIERSKTGWEIQGIPQSVIAKFSRRTAQIEEKAEALGIADPKSKDALGALTRESKRHGLTFPDLLAEWGARLTDAEKVQISKACFEKHSAKVAQVTAAEAMDYAISKLFERQSVVDRGHILSAALRYGAGQLTPDSIRQEFERRGFLGRKIDDQHLCTLPEVLAEEVALLRFVRNGRNSSVRLGGSKSPIIEGNLSKEQRAAVQHILTSRDQVIAVRGAAGVGKTTLMKEASRIIESQGFKVFAFAPSAAASRGTLREEGFSTADTVAQLLVNVRLQKEARGQVVWVDEAGLLGIRDMWQLMQIVGPNTRLILTGDAAQHAPVARGDAFRILQKHAGLRIAEVAEIRRQQVEAYRFAVAALSCGDLNAGFLHLDAIGAFVEISDDVERYRALAEDYTTLAKRGRAPLVVSPTHAESALVTDAIRSACRQAGKLGVDRRYMQYQNLQWEEVERSLAGNYKPGLLVQFHQNVKGIKRGEMFRVVIAEEGRVALEIDSGRKTMLPLGEARKFLVYEERELNLAKGDRIRITRNGTSSNGKRLDNGNAFTIKKFGKNGEIILENGAILPKNHGHLTHGYCHTSHSSQSKSVRDVLVAQSRKFLVASSREQFYVSCSRGKETIRIYTDDRRLLREAVGVSSSRMSGIELAGLTKTELSSFMSRELGAKQWRDVIVSRRGSDGSKTFEQQIAEQRKSEPRKTGEVTNWEGYIDMRRKNVTADGKKRSKGYNATPSKKAEPAKGRGLPKTSHLSDSYVRGQAEKKVAKKEAGKTETKSKTETKPKPPKQNRQERLAKAYEAGAKHFKKVVDKVKGAGKDVKRQISVGRNKVTQAKKQGVDRAAKHAARAKVEAQQQKPKAQQKKKEQVKQAPPPVMKKR